MQGSDLELRYIAELGCDPVYASDGAAGLDLRSAEDVTLLRAARVAIRTGLRIELPPGHVGLLRGRSGWARTHGVLAFEGTIDADYRGEMRVLLVNLGSEPVRVRRGDRIAQLLVMPVARCTLERVDALSETERGERGFGSTGI